MLHHSSLQVGNAPLLFKIVVHLLVYAFSNHNDWLNTAKLNQDCTRPSQCFAVKVHKHCSLNLLQRSIYSTQTQGRWSHFEPPRAYLDHTVCRSLTTLSVAQSKDAVNCYAPSPSHFGCHWPGNPSPASSKRVLAWVTNGPALIGQTRSGACQPSPPHALHLPSSHRF